MVQLHILAFFADSRDDAMVAVQAPHYVVHPLQQIHGELLKLGIHIEQSDMRLEPNLLPGIASCVWGGDMKVYLSATYKDLTEYRKAAYQQLRKMRNDVIGMEDYAASDQRPVDKCLADVADSDVYLGVFAWRYGFIPSRDNPKKQSITELEYSKARELGKPCLIFLLEEDAPWPGTMMDAQTSDAGAGERIKQLRAKLADAHVVSYFSTPDQLGGLIAAAIFQVNVGITRVHEVSEASERRPSTGRARARAKYPKLWSPGSVLRVRFIQRNPSFERAIRRYLPLWTAHANVQFEFSADNDAEVRVAFANGQGNWAYIGTDCMAIPLDQPTMNFSFLDPAEINVLHEFGHVLGLLHEHNHPHGITWNKEAVYKAMTGPPNNWDKKTIAAEMFTRWPNRTFPFQKQFDPHSIMAYPMAKEWTSLETGFGYRDSLSQVDKDFIGRLYPYDD